LLQGGALLLGGALVTLLGLRILGEGSVIEGWRYLSEAEEAKLHVVLPWNDPDVPWLAVFIGGLWIPNLFYWGLNQFITQRTLGAKSLAEGQRGIMLAATLKLAIPFIIVIPGIMAFQLFGPQINELGGNVGDKAYPYMISRILPPQLRGIMFAALAGAVMSTFNSGLNSAATIFSIDIYQRYLNRDASQKRLVLIGRIATTVIVVIACLWAPVVSRFEGVFKYIQEIWGFITPGIVAAFLVGLLASRAPPLAAKTALLLGLPLYALCRVPKWIWDSHYTSTHPGATAAEIVAPEGSWEVVYQFSCWSFLHHMGLVFLVLAAIMLIITWRRPLAEPVRMPTSDIDTTVPRHIYVLGCLVIGATVALYVIFW
jgi:SSS family solute:Na+ symporter